MQSRSSKAQLLCWKPCHVAAAKLLCEHEAVRSEQEGAEALISASANGHVAVAQLLLDHGGQGSKLFLEYLSAESLVRIWSGPGDAYQEESEHWTSQPTGTYP